VQFNIFIFKFKLTVTHDIPQLAITNYMNEYAQIEILSNQRLLQWNNPLMFIHQILYQVNDSIPAEDEATR